MTIVSSEIVADTAQSDGRRQIHELHTDHAGAKHDHHYKAQSGENAQTNLAAWAAILDAQLTENEIVANVADVVARGSLANPTTVYSTAAANFAALRAFYQTATRLQAVMAGDYLNGRTDAQLRNAFNMTQGQVDTLRANKLGPAATLATSIRATTGQ